MAAAFGQAPAPTNGVPQERMMGNVVREPIVYHVDLSTHKPGTGGGGGGGTPGIVLGREQLAEILASSADTISFDGHPDERLQLNAKEMLKRPSEPENDWSSYFILDRWGLMLVLLCAALFLAVAYHRWQAHRRAMTTTKNPNTKKEK